MKILPATDENISIAAKIIKNGGVVVFPTDTVYGIGCDLHNLEAVERIYRIKGRPSTMPLIAMFADIEDYKLLTASKSLDAEKYMHQFWPGALTIILSAKPDLPQRVLAGGNTVGMRIPSHPVALSLLREIGISLATTSANLSGMPSPCSAEDAIKSLGIDSDVEIVLDAGITSGGIPSTLLDCTKYPPAILREGDITAEMLGL